MRIRWLLWAAFLALILTYLHTQAILHFLYWFYDWFDILMHFLGGLAIAVFLIGFFVTERRALLIGGFFALVIGWEIFEYLFGLPRESAYVLDTIIDLVMDTLGGALAYAIAHKTLWRR